MLYSVLIVVVALIINCLCLPLDDFYPFGSRKGDKSVSHIVGYSKVVLSEDLILFNQIHRELIVSLHGKTAVVNHMSCVYIISPVAVI